MRQALADVGCLVVDEIHLLGDPARGPVLEALLARVRGTGSPVRIVGLSATARAPVARQQDGRSRAPRRDDRPGLLRAWTPRARTAPRRDPCRRARRRRI